MSVIIVSAIEADRMIKNGAKLIDIREVDEHLRLSIPSSQNFALSQFSVRPPRVPGPVIFHCKGGNRTAVNSDRLLNAVKDNKIYLLEGGIEAWQTAGLPTTTRRNQPIEIMRQVQIGAGLMVISGLVFGAFMHPAFYLLSGAAGAGLIFAGVTGLCGMARILKHAPWNRSSHVTGH